MKIKKGLEVYNAQVTVYLLDSSTVQGNGSCLGSKPRQKLSPLQRLYSRSSCASSVLCYLLSIIPFCTGAGHDTLGVTSTRTERQAFRAHTVTESLLGGIYLAQSQKAERSVTTAALRDYIFVGVPDFKSARITSLQTKD